jgi:ABC-type branched-subunit amino acid transport system ATPase component/ABC-type branched-subunit amino acid transport system permease subunit
MSTALTFALLGLGIGATYAIAAMGIVVIYRGSGVVNFAHIGMAVVGAFTFSETRDAGWPVAAALALGLAASGVLGLLTHLLVMQRMQHASTLTRVVATLGLLLVLQSATALKFGEGLRLVPSLLPTDQVRIGAAKVGADRLYLVGLSGAIGLALWAGYRFTRFGQLTTAVAEGQRAVAAIGRSPQTIALANWVIGAVLAGMAGILLAPVVGLSLGTLGSLLIPALAAALVGGFSSFALSWVGAIAIGVAQSEVTRYVSAPGWSSALPILVVIAVLLLRGRSLPERGAIQDRLPAVGGGFVPGREAIAWIAILVVLVCLVDVSWVDAITVAAIVGIVCLSLTVLTGYAGQLSLAQFALAGCAALAAARSSAAWGLPFWAAAAFAVVVTTVLGLAVALPALRVRGVTLAIVTLGIAVVVEQAVMGNPAYTGGAGGTTVEPPTVAGLSLDATVHPTRYGLLCVAFLALAGWVVSNLRRGMTGRRLLAVRGNERAAGSLGLDVVALKLYAFAVSAALAAVGGVLLAFQTPTVLFQDGFEAQRSIDVLGVTVIGGLGYIGGALFGAAGTAGGPVAYGLDQLSDSRDLLGLITGSLMLLTLAIAPNGIFPLEARRYARMRSHLRRRRAAAPALLSSSAPEAHTARAEARALGASNLAVSFGATRALDDVSLELRSGEVLGVIGPNGAGKTTLIDVLTGLTRPGHGAVRLDGADITALSLSARARRGVVRSYQSLELFEDLTVVDNLRVASEFQGRLAGVMDLVRPRDAPLSSAAVTAVRELRLDAVLDRTPGELSYGQRRLLAIARALAAGPSILLLDEPAAGLDEEERAELGRLLRRLADDWGLGVLLVEHDVSLVADASDRVVALDFGRVVAAGRPEEVLREPTVIRAYLGGEVDDAGDPEAATTTGTTR